MDNSDVDVLPTVHASTVATMSAAFQATRKCGYELLHYFVKSEISYQMILLAENILVECISKSSEWNNFDDIRFEIYHQHSHQITSNIVIRPHSHKTSMLPVLSLGTMHHWIYWNKPWRLLIWVNRRWYVSSYNYYKICNTTWFSSTMQLLKMCQVTCVPVMWN